MNSNIVAEQVHFRFIPMECCGHHLCWVNPRLPTHCPQCGRQVYPAVKSWVTFEDPRAIIKLEGTPFT